MNNKTQTTKLKNFKVIQDGEVVFDSTPTAADVARERVVSKLVGIYGNFKLEARMVAFDTLHRTNYRAIRHELMKQKKREAFERSIGLVPVGKK